MPDREPVNEQDFLKMQQDAIRRVRDMQVRARRTLAEDGIPLESQPPAPAAAAAQEAPPQPAPPLQPQRPTIASMRPPAPPAYANLGTLRPAMREYPIEPPEPEAPPAPALAPAPAMGLPNPLGSLFHLSLDSEQLMLMGILYMLYRDHGDPTLMLALGYLLLG